MLEQKWMRFLWKYYRSHKALFFLYLFFSSWVGLQALFNSYLTKILIDNLGEETLRFQALLIPTILILVNYEIHNICWRAIQAINLRWIPQIKAQITEDLFQFLHQKPYPDFQKTLTGSHMSNINILTEAFERLTGNVFVRLIRGGTQLIAAFIFMWWIHSLFALIFATWTLLFVSLNFFFSRTIHSLSDELAKCHSDVSGKIVDSLTNGKEVRLFGQFGFEQSILKIGLNKLKKSYKKKGRFFLKFYLVQGISITCLVGIMLYILIQQRLAGTATIGDFAFILGSTFFLTDMVWSNTELLDQLNDIIGQCKQSLQSLLFCRQNYDKDSSKSSLIYKKGEIIFDQVSFGYSPNKYLYVNQTLHIEPGEKLGLVGRSGAGKSTLTHLLLSLYPLLEGKILIDRQDISKISLSSLYQTVGVLSQEPSLFCRSLKENIRFGKPNASDKEVFQSAKAVGIEEWVHHLPHKYESLLGEKGFKLSGGQRQMVALARIVLKDAPILILDEPTSQLDAVSEEILSQSLYSFMEGKTTIAITHRLSTLVRMDRIIVLEHGKIIEEGTHEVLMEKRGTYYGFWDVQNSGLFQGSM